MSLFPQMREISPITFALSLYGKERHDNWQYFPEIKRIGRQCMFLMAIEFPDGTYLGYREIRRRSQDHAES